MQTFGYLLENIGDLQREIVRLDNAGAQNPKEWMPRPAGEVTNGNRLYGGHGCSLLGLCF